jgi:serine/threonine protein kinase
MASPAIISARYEIRGIVGRGGMGLVYKAFDRVIGRDVALKTLVDVQGRVAVEMFYKEWRILANLHHPNIIEIFDIGEFDDGGVIKPFFVMPLLPGMTLDQMLQLPGQQLHADRLDEIVSQVCRGLQAIHDSGLVHRDIKPSNIFVMEFNAVKVIDLGVAHLLGGNTATGVKGTVSYMAPEQIESHECSPASDIFSLGVVCYEALGGVRPFQGKNTEVVFDAILHHIPAPVCEINPSVSQAVSRVIHKALAKQPRHRYASALEFADTLHRAFRGEAIPTLDPSRIQPRIQRAIRAFEQGNYQMATDILSDLEAAGHFDPALRPLRSKIDQAMQRNAIRDLLSRAQMGIEEEEFTLALQNAEAALKIEPGNEAALRLREVIQAKIAERDVAEWLHGAEEAISEYAFSRARQLLRNVLEVRPGDPQAASLFELLENRERAYRAARQEKEELYKSAREAWDNSEFASAAAKLERVLQLEKNAPDTSSPESATNYSSFLSLVRSAQMVVDNTRDAAMTYIAAGRYEAAVEICRECTSKYPGHPVPQGLALLAESERKREMLTRMADAIRGIGAETELEKKLELLKEAMEAFPAEPLFEQWMRPVRDRLAQVKAVVAKAQAHEERGRFLEALEQWRMVEAIYPQYAGLQEEIGRVQTRAGEAGAVVRAAATMASAATVSYHQDSEITIDLAAPVAVPEKEQAPPVPVASEAPVGPSLSSRVKPAIDAIKLRTAELRPALARLATRVQPAAAEAWIRIASTRLLMRRAGWALTAGVAVLVLVGVVLMTMARNRPHPKVVAAPSLARVVIRASDGGVSIRIGNKVLGLTNGEAQTDLAPGTYTIDAEKDGYESFSGPIQVLAGGLTQTLPPLRALAAGLHISTDLQRGRVRLDDRTEEHLQNGEWQADNVAAGDHTLTVWDSRSQARLIFSTADGQAPQLKEIVEAKELQAFVITGIGRTSRLASSVALTKAVLASGTQTGDEGGTFRFTDLIPGLHRVNVADGKVEHTFAFDAGPRPSIHLVVYTDRDVGSLSVNGGVDRFQVFLDGVLYERPVRNGVMNIQNIAAKTYRVRVIAEGYDAAPEQDAIVNKGELTTLEFKLTASPQYAALVVHGLPLRTQVLLDGSALSTHMDAEGNLRADRIPPGEHQLEFRNPPQYKPEPLRKSFGKGETVTLTDIRLQNNPAEVTITAVPENAQLEIQCGQVQLPRRQAPANVPCAESSITVRASAEGYRGDPRTVALSPGVPQTMHIAMTRIPAAATPPPKRSCSVADLGSRGWNLDQGWYVAVGADTALPCEELVGAYVFTVRVPKGTLGIGVRPTTWKVTGGKLGLECSLDRKWLSSGGATRLDIGKLQQNGAVTVRVVIEPERIVHQVRDGESWRQLDSREGDFHKARILFSKDSRIAQMTFTER